MKSDNQMQETRSGARPGTVGQSIKSGRRQRKNRSLAMSRVKTLIAGLSIAATAGGWGMMAQHDATTSAQTSGDGTVASLVSEAGSQQTPEATATLQAAQATGTPQATVTATLSSAVQTIATAAPQSTATVAIEASPTTEATATAMATATAATVPKPTATPKPTSTPKPAIAVTRSSK